MKQKLIDLIRAFAILYGLFYLGEGIAYLLPIGIPGSIFGLLLFFLGLTSGVIRLEWVQFGTSLLLRYMGVLFVPVSVGIMKYSDLLIQQAKALLIPNVISSLLTLVIFALLADRFLSSKSSDVKEDK